MSTGIVRSQASKHKIQDHSPFKNLSILFVFMLLRNGKRLGVVRRSHFASGLKSSPEKEEKRIPEGLVNNCQGRIRNEYQHVQE
jgi:hypothetical protein